MLSIHILCLTLALTLVLPSDVFAQPTEGNSPLSVEQIMQELERWIGDWPTNVRWHESGTHVYFDWNPKGAFESDSLFKTGRSGTEPEKVSPSERRSHPAFYTGPHHGERIYTDDHTRKVYAAGGDLYVYDHTSDRKLRLTDTPAAERSPRFSPDGQAIIFRRDDNLFAIDLADGSLRQLTDLRPGREPQKPDTTAREQFLSEQQTALFETLKEEKMQQQLAEEAAERDRNADDPPPTYYTGDRDVRELRLDPTGRWVAFGLQSEPDAAKPTTVTDYVTLTGRARTLEARSKVGIPQENYDLYLQDLARDTTYRVDLHQLPGAYDVPNYRKSADTEVDSSEARRALYSYGPFWSADGEHAVLVVRADDNKDRWIARLDPTSGELTVLHRQHNDAWIAGPGIGWFGGAGNVGWMPDGERFYFKSEATGYSHLYTVDVSSGSVEQLTSGEFVVADARLTTDGSAWVFLSSAASPHSWHVYRMPADGGSMTQITRRPTGATPTRSDNFAVSPDGDRLAVLFSSRNHPPELYVQDLGRPAQPERITDSPTDEWLSYDWRDPTITTFEASDGTDVPVQIFRPDEPNGAAVWFVHGAGYLQDVTRHWSSFYFREYMFHNLLADLGYTVLSLDYRGSAGYGSDWRTAIYRHMGGRDLQDYIDGSRWLSETREIPPERQFIYGGSYGGFMTLMALFEAPDRFGGGAALRSVTDWAHYNDPYTSSILNDPQTDSLAYARSSPIYHAEGLEDPLLMAHGLVDQNVQAQDIFRLSQRLIEFGKEDWELAIYPIEGHGFIEPTSWTDEYRRILELIRSSVGKPSGP